MIESKRFRNLFIPGLIGQLELKNRIVMSAMGTRYCGIWGEVTDRMIEWYRRRAQGGCALVMIESTLAATAVDLLRMTTLQLRADDTCYIPGLASLVEAIHESGARAGIQLSAGGGAQAKAGPWTPGFQMIRKMEPVSPSGVPGLGRSDHPRVLTQEEIEKIIELCGVSAWNVKQAGFDIIEIHAHGGYLISQFLSPYFNKRQDRYGGSFENRCRFLLEIIRAMRKTVGMDLPLVVKFSINDFLPGSWDENQSKDLSKELELEGVNGIGISSGVHGSKLPATPPYFFPPGVFLPFAEIIKEVVNIPVLVGGRLSDPELAERTLKKQIADFIYEGRALIADPDWPHKVHTERIEQIRPCLACNECRQQIVELQSVRCTVNAVAGREREYGDIKQARDKKKVLIAGGGPAGMEAARVSALRGHQVTLCERHGQLGGRMTIGGIHNEQITKFSNWMVEQIKNLDVEVQLQTEVSVGLVEKLKPDALILATGGTFSMPKIPGIDSRHVFSAQDLFNLINGISIKKNILLSSFFSMTQKFMDISTVRKLLKSNLFIKEKICIIGGQFSGCSMALALVNDQKKVILIEESDVVGNGMEKHTLTALREKEVAGELKILSSARVEQINDEGVVVDISGDRVFYECDAVFVALEPSPSESHLGEKLKRKIKEIYTIGDAKSFQRIRKAISEGYVTAFRL